MARTGRTNLTIEMDAEITNKIQMVRAIIAITNPDAGMVTNTDCLRWLVNVLPIKKMLAELVTETTPGLQELANGAIPPEPTTTVPDDASGKRGRKSKRGDRPAPARE